MVVVREIMMLILEAIHQPFSRTCNDCTTIRKVDIEIVLSN